MDLFHDPFRIIRTLAFALRHNPWQFGLELDPEGWTDINDLVQALRLNRPDWSLLDWPEIEAAIRGADRFEVQSGRIRAAYGHSITLGKPPDVAHPPTTLYHGTSLNAVPSIVQNGLQPMSRRFVHFSSDIDWVIDFVTDKTKWLIFAIDTDAAVQSGIEFRKANFHVWLADSMDPRLLAVRFSNVTESEISRVARRSPFANDS